MKRNIYLLSIIGLAMLSVVLTATAKTKATTLIDDNSSSMSFIVLGDLHYDKLEYHDMAWLSEKPGDLRQVTESYVPNTEKNWSELMGVLRSRVDSFSPPIKAVIQLGDLSEGLAGSEPKAKEMAQGTIAAIKDANLGGPWLLAKGNHDVTGPGAKEAFTEFYTPYIKEQTGFSQLNNATYSYRVGKTQVVVVDPWDSTIDVAQFITESFEGSDAKYRFISIHEPAIPVTERCWHYLRKNPEARDKFIEAVAKSKAIVLTAHLHRYSVVKRETNYGPIIQVMMVSVVGQKRASKPSYSFTTSDYGPALVDWKPSYEPDTAQSRRDILAQEAKYVTYYQMCDLAGYGIISIDDTKQEVVLKYYAAFQSVPYDTVNLTELYNATN